MSSDVAPLLVGFAAAGSLLVLIAIALATRRLVERTRLRPSRRQSWTSEGATTSQEWVYRPRARREGPAEPLGRTAKADAGAGNPSADGQGSITALEEAEQRAQELLVAAEREREGLRRESEAEAERINEDARRQARELLEEAELEAKRIVVAAGQERARLVNELAEERASLEETRMRVDSLSTVQAAELRAEELLLTAERQCESLRRESEAQAERKAAEIIEDARRRAAKRLEEAELEARGIVVETGTERARLLTDLAQERSLLEETRTKLDSPTALEEAAHAAEELLAVAERQREALLRESEAEAMRRADAVTDMAQRAARELLEKAELEAEKIAAAAEHRREGLLRESQAEAERTAEEITEGARRQAEELLQRAELEARRIIATAAEERARLVNELAQERSVLEETRTTLSGFLADFLEEVERAPAPSGELVNVDDLSEVRGVRTSAGAGH